MKIVDLVGHTYGRLRPLRRAATGIRRVAWVCACECGNETTVRAHNLRSGGTTSCGCHLSDVVTLRNQVDKPSRKYVDSTISSRNQIVVSYRKNAKARGFEWALSEEVWLRLLTDNCHYCGVEPKQVRVGRGGSGKPMPGFTYNGIDRVDNTLGYTVNNCVTCCGICNHAKATLPYEAFVAWLDRICAFRSER